MDLVVTPVGTVRCLYAEAIDLAALGRAVDHPRQPRRARPRRPLGRRPAARRGGRCSARSCVAARPWRRRWTGCVRTCSIDPPSWIDRQSPEDLSSLPHPIAPRPGRRAMGRFRFPLFPEHPPMTQSQLDHAIAHTTGESLQTIRRLGFRTRPVDLEPEDLVLALDCPFCGRTVALDARPACRCRSSPSATGATSTSNIRRKSCTPPSVPWREPTANTISRTLHDHFHSMERPLDVHDLTTPGPSPAGALPPLLPGPAAARPGTSGRLRLRPGWFVACANPHQIARARLDRRPDERAHSTRARSRSMPSA